MQLSFKEPSSELARRFHHFQGVWLRSGTVHGAPFYRQSGNLINWLGRFQPLDAYGPAGWAVSDPFEAGTVQVGHAPDGHASERVQTGQLPQPDALQLLATRPQRRER